MADTRESLASELRVLRAKLGSHLTAATVSLDAATAAVAAATGVAADVDRLAARIEALPTAPPPVSLSTD